MHNLFVSLILLARLTIAIMTLIILGFSISFVLNQQTVDSSFYVLCIVVGNILYSMLGEFAKWLDGF